MCLKNLNTSYVNVNLISQADTIKVESNLNTSYVNVNHFLVYKTKGC